MKRILAWVLTLVLVLGLFAGCKQQEEAPATTQPAQQDEVITANDAMAYLKALYPKSEEAMKTPVNFERPGIIRVGGIPFTIVWSTDLPEEQIKIVVSEDGATVTIDVNEQCEADTAYVLTATITDEQGNTASTTWDCLLPEAIDMVGLVKEAYALKAGESLPYEATLRGKIINIDTAWNPEYQNITVTIAVEGAEDMPIECYRLKGEGADKLQVGNIITVTGTLKNYQGTIEFDAGCVLDAVEQGDAVEALTDVGEILKAAYKLKDGKSLGYSVELTGKVTEIDTPYDPGYKNISVVIEVEGYSKYPILCYRLKGGDVDAIAVDDVITVTGLIKNYKGTIEFDAGCQMIKRVSGGGVAAKPSSDAKKILADAKKLKSGEKLDYYATLTGEVVSLDDPYSSQYKNVTVTIEVNGVKIQCYRMKGDDASKVRVTDKITVTGQIENYNGKLEFGAGCTLDSWTKGSRKVTVDYGPLSENTAYKMEMKLPPLGKNVYFNGKISSSNYLQTGTYAEGVEVFMEKHTGDGVRFYFMNNDVKTYIEIFINSEDKARPTLKTEPSVYWNYDEDTGVYTVSIDWVKYYLGTYTNSTSGTTPDSASASKISYLTSSTKGKTQFYFDFVTEPSEAPDAPENPDTPVVPGTPTVAVTELKTGDQVVIFAPAYNKALSTQPAKEGSYYQKGVNVTLSNGVLSGYGATETWTVTVNPDGTYSFANGGKNIAMGASYSSMKLGEVNDDWKLDSLGGTLFSVKNVGRGNYMQWADSFGNYSTYNGDPETDSQYHLSFYVIDKGLYGVEGGDTPDTPDVPGAAVTELKTGDQVVIFAPAYNKALSTQPAQEGSYYQKGVDVTLSNGVLSGYGATETWTVTVNADGSYSFANGGENIAMGASYSSMKLGEVNDKWELGSLGGTLFSVKNAGRGNYMQWAENFGNYSTYNGDPATDKQFQLSFYVVDKGLYGVEGGNTPDTPDTPIVPDTPAAGTATKLTALPVDGDVIVIYNSNKAMGNTASGNKIAAVDGTVTGDSLALTDAMAQLKVVVEGNNYIFMLGDKYLTSGATGNSMSYADTLTDCGRWTIAAATEGTWYITNVGANYNGNYNQAMEYYNGFTTYGKRETAIYQMELYKVPEAPAGGQLLSALPADGDMIVIVNGTKAMGNAASGNKIAAVDAEIAENVLTLTDDMAQLKVVVEGNNYIFMLGDKYLTSGATGNSMSYADTLTDCGRWTIAAATEGTWYITNVGANYNGNYNQAMEYYNGFTTYGKRETAIYQMQMFKVGASGTTPEQPEQPPVNPPAGNELTIEEAIALGTPMAQDTFTTEKYKVTGVIDEIYNTQYGNMYIKDAAGNRLKIFGTWDATGATRYDALNVKPVVGDTVILLGVIGNFNGAQMKDGWIIEHLPAGNTPEQPENPPVNPDEPVGESATITFDDTAKRTSLSDNQQVWTENEITVTIDKGSSTSPINGQYFKPLRIYKNHVMTVAYPGIVKLEMDCNYSTYVQPFVDAVNALADSNIESVTAEGTVVTVVFKTAVDSFTATMSSAQVRANYITVYEAPESTEPENPPVNPEQPVVGGGAADFNTIVTSNANGDSGYSNSYSTTNGWSITNSAIQSGGTTDSNPQFIVIGPDNTHKAVCLNGKTTAPGKITSPELSGGISKLTVKFTKIFTDTELSATVTITEVATGTTQTHVIARTLDKNEKYQVYTEEWTLETPVTGAFTMEIVNNSPTGQTTNKDRMTILSIEWEGAAPAAPAITSETFTMADYKVDGELGGGEATRTLGELLTCKLSSGWFTTEARICKNEHMILSSTESMASVVLNAGYKDSTFNVYVSADGETWTEHQMGVAYVSGYGDVTIELPAGCKFVKFDAPNAQVRIKTITVNYG